MRKTMTLSLLLLAGVAGVALATSPPALINYQGVLRSASNAPLNGTFDMVFRFYDDLTGGNEILVDSHTGPGSVTVTNGLFSAQLGGGVLTDGSGPGTYASLRDVSRDYGNLYLEVRVGTETLSPRTQIVSGGFALNADRLQGNDPSAFAPTAHAHTGSDITSGKIDNARINTGHGNGLDADTVDGVHAAQLLSSGPKSMVIDTGEITASNGSSGILGPYDLDGFDTVSVQVAEVVPPGGGAFSFPIQWSNDVGMPFASAFDCLGRNCSSSFPSVGAGVVALNVIARNLQLSYSVPVSPAGTWTFRVVLYLRRQG